MSEGEEQQKQKNRISATKRYPPLILSNFLLCRRWKNGSGPLFYASTCIPKFSQAGISVLIKWQLMNLIITDGTYEIGDQLPALCRGMDAVRSDQAFFPGIFIMIDAIESVVNA